MIKKPKDMDYYNAISNIKNIDVDIKKEEEILINLKHLRSIHMKRVVQSENWINDI
jgi:hypothetical protein